VKRSSLSYTFLGVSWKLLGLPVGFLIYDIIYLFPRKPKKLPGSSQDPRTKFRAEILE